MRKEIEHKKEISIRLNTLDYEKLEAEAKLRAVPISTYAKLLLWERLQGLK